jgi:hypothetical protein
MERFTGNELKALNAFLERRAEEERLRRMQEEAGH